MPGRGSVNPEKLAEVAALEELFLAKPMTALVGFRGVPASALQSMRRELRRRGHPIKVATNSAIGHALEAAVKKRPALEPLRAQLQDQTAILTAEGNPFSLFQELVKTRSPTPARGGEIAPHDIVVPSGPTSFKPGPIVGELQHAGLPAAIEKGKVVLKKETLIVRAGQPISREVATMLTRLEIFPLEVGLELRAVVEGTTFFPRELLAVDLDAQMSGVVRAHHRAVAVALEIGYPSAFTTPLLVARALRRALAFATAAGYVTPTTLPAILARALREAAAIEHLTGA